MQKSIRFIAILTLIMATATPPANANPLVATITRWKEYAGAIIQFFLVEGTKTALEISVGNALSTTAPEIKVSYHIHTYERIQTNSLPNHPVTASVFKMIRDGEGNPLWSLKSSVDGKLTYDGPATNGLPGMFYNSWAKNCILVHENKAYPNHFSEHFTVLVQVQVVNYNALPKSARPTTVTIDFCTEAYRLFDNCQPTDPSKYDPNRQDVRPRAVTTITIGADGYGANRGTVLSPGSFQSYTQMIHTSEITVSTAPLSK